MLIEQTLFGIIDKVANAINLLREYEPSEGYYLCFSGGKDSVTIYALAKMAGVKFDAHYNTTTVEPPEVLTFIREQYPDVVIELPKYTMAELIVKKRMPPTRIARYCSKYLKCDTGQGRIKITGIRAEESRKRAKYPQVEKNKSGGISVHLIHKWSTTDVWDFIHTNNIPYCSLYDEGFKRLGCVLCPFGNKSDTKRDLKRFPTVVDYYREACRQSFEINNSLLKYKKWTSGDDMFDWWINRYDKKHQPKDNSLPLFDDLGGI